MLAKHGYVHVTDIPDGFDYPRFLATFGEFYPGPSGELIEDVSPEAGMDDVYYGGNQQALLPHTECYEFDGLPPRYLALWCVVPPSGGGGETTLLDTAPLLADLTGAERNALRRRDFEFRASAGLQRRGFTQRAFHPVLDSVDTLPVLRFSCNNVVVPGHAAAASAFLKRTRLIFEAEHTAITYRRNDLLHWDNWRMLHSRTAFEDPTRRLRRVQLMHARAGEP
jgi:alpha-ketoglutarate-dependent taurine dioxygenase